MELNLFGYKIRISKEVKSDTELPADLKKAFEVIKKYGYKPEVSKKKTDSAKRATAIRQQRAKEKINNAINLLKLENKKITLYSIAKTAGVSYNTVKKYENELKNILETS